MTDLLAARLAMEAAIEAAEATAAEVAPETARRTVHDDVAEFLRANPPKPGPTGSQGLTGVGEPGLVFRGPWSRTATYVPPEVAESEGSAYVAIAPSTGQRPPGPAWALLVRKGKDGVNGMGQQVVAGRLGVFVDDEGAPVNGAQPVGEIDFQGAGVSAVMSGTKVIVTIPGGGAGGSSFPDYKQTADPGAVGAGKTWLELPPDIAPDAWQALTVYGENARVVPTVSNGHFYSATAGTSGASEPVFPTDSSSVADGSVIWSDQGPITAVEIETLQLYRRNDTDSAWIPVGVGDLVWPLGERRQVTLWNTDGTRAVRTMLVNDHDDLPYEAHYTYRADGTVLMGWWLGSDGFEVLTDDGSGTVTTGIRPGTVDPTVAPGVFSIPGSLYLRQIDSSTSGELYQKTGVLDTDWTRIGFQATFVDPPTATPEAIANALIAAGLMAAA